MCDNQPVMRYLLLFNEQSFDLIYCPWKTITHIKSISTALFLYQIRSCDKFHVVLLMSPLSQSTWVLVLPSLIYSISGPGKSNLNWLHNKHDRPKVKACRAEWEGGLKEGPAVNSAICWPWFSCLFKLNSEQTLMDSLTVQTLHSVYLTLTYAPFPGLG